MIYDVIKLQYFGKEVYLHFRDRITVVRGDSGTGKSLIFQILRPLKVSEQYRNIECLNYESMSLLETQDEVLKQLEKYKNKLVVIDNAELLLNKSSRTFIANDEDNQYVIIGRNIEGLGVMKKGFCRVVDEGKTIELQYEYDDAYFKREPLKIEAF